MSLASEFHDIAEKAREDNQNRKTIIMDRLTSGEDFKEIYSELIDQIKLEASCGGLNLRLSHTDIKELAEYQLDSEEIRIMVGVNYNQLQSALIDALNEDGFEAEFNGFGGINIFW